ncbi:hypothetical protein CDES_14540 (plasmid) [Corynebacterium deserti GIMN1.010]|uniref:Uncharacterized protein n=1 Tax=Corynebacterium deserti GIMN1.010 TaxID=931089 RepID=A0A0M4CKR4_9CORY|nr:hypothetical protein CDES_14540 [Corynebacterium deserti GIMN1.010]
MGLLEAEGAAADEDEDAQADQDDREQHVLPALKDFCDGRAGGHELCQQDQACHQDEENDAVDDDGGSVHVEEDRDVDADIVATVGKRHTGDGQHTHLFPGDLRIIIVVIIASPGLPGHP